MLDINPFLADRNNPTNANFFKKFQEQVSQASGFKQTTSPKEAREFLTQLEDMLTKPQNEVKTNNVELPPPTIT